MTEHDWLAERFEEHRARLRAVAYRMLGSVSEADDAVQEAWLRLSRADDRRRREPGGWLTTVVARVSPEHAAVARRAPRGAARRRTCPIRSSTARDGADPEHEALLADSVGLALLVVLETLTPAERLAFVLHDMFAVPFDEIAAIVDRSPDAARQLASRGAPPRPGRRRRSRTPNGPPARGRGRVPRGLPRGRLRGAARACSIRRSCSCSTSAQRPRRRRGRFAARRRWPARRSPSRRCRRRAAGAGERRGPAWS